MRTAKRIIKNSSVLILSHIISKTLYFFIVILITRLLGVEEFGKFTFAFSFVVLFSIIADLGLNTLTIREVARSKSEAARYFKNGTFLKLFLSVITYGIIVIAINLTGYTSPMIKVVYILGLWIILDNFTHFLFSFFRAFEKMEYEAYLNVIDKGVLFLFALIASKYNWGVSKVAMIFLGAAFIKVSIGLFFIFINKALPIAFSIELKISWAFCKSLLKKSWPFALMSVFGVIYGRIDMVMLQIMKGNMAVGWYGASHKLIEGLMFMPQMFVVALFPVFSKLFTDSKQKLIMGYEKSFEFLFIIGFPLAIGGTLLSKKIIFLLYGAEFINSSPALRVLIWALFFVFLNFVVGTTLNSINRQRLLALNAGICVVVNVVLNLILIPVYSFVGAAAATVVTEAVLFMLGFYWIGKYLYGLPIWKLVYRPLIAGMLMGVGVFLFKNMNLFFVISAGIISYTALLFVFGVFSRENINLIKQGIS